MLIAEVYYRRKSDKDPRTQAFKDAMGWYNLAVEANEYPDAYNTLSIMQRMLRWPNRC